jgi:hypothetical protein
MKFGRTIRRHKRLFASVVAMLLVLILVLSLALPFFNIW